MFTFSSILGQNKDMFFFGGKLIEYAASLDYEFCQAHPDKFLDSIFIHSLKLSDGNISDALLFCSIGTVPYSEFSIKLLPLNFPIKVFIFNQISEPDFEGMKRNLPVRIFWDSPQDDFGDKDKITHIFSSAFWSYVTNKNAAYIISTFVEHFEEGFKIQSNVDNRDLAANQIGIKFGAFLTERLVMPSEIILKDKSLVYGKDINN